MSKYTHETFGTTQVWDDTIDEWRDVNMDDPVERAYHERIQDDLRRSFSTELELTVNDKVLK